MYGVGSTTVNFTMVDYQVNHLVLIVGVARKGDILIILRNHIINIVNIIGAGHNQVKTVG